MLSTGNKILNRVLLLFLRFKMLLTGVSSLESILASYLVTDFDSNSCGRQCYQNYQTASHDFYLSCRLSINSTLLPLASALGNFQEFRNQACGKSLLFSLN